MQPSLTVGLVPRINTPAPPLNSVLVWSRAFSDRSGTIHEITRTAAIGSFSNSCVFVDRFSLRATHAQNKTLFRHFE